MCRCTPGAKAAVVLCRNAFTSCHNLRKSGYFEQTISYVANDRIRQGRFGIRTSPCRAPDPPGPTAIMRPEVDSNRHRVPTSRSDDVGHGPCAWANDHSL